MPATALASSTSFTWTGTSTTTEAWSEPANWQGDSAPKASTEIGTLSFPRLTSTACIEETEEQSCYFSENDIGGLSTESLRLDDGDFYYIFGEALTLGKGGLDAAPASGSSGEGLDFLEMPVKLSSSQTWSITGREEDPVGEDGLLLTEPITGSGKALTVKLADKPALYLANGTEVGPVTIEGEDAGEAGVLNGFAGLLDGQLNYGDGEPVELSHIFFVGDGAVGKLATNHAEVFVGSGGKPAAALRATSVKLDPASEVAFDITGEGTTAGEDYSQLTSSGAIELESSWLDVEVSPPKEGEPCPVLHNGQSYTFVSTTGTLSGAFSDAPQGAEIPITFARSCKSSPQKLKIGYEESGGTQTVTATVESGEKAPEVTKEPASVEVVKGEEATFEAAASGVPTPSVQWEVSTNGGTSWSQVSGATSDVLRVASTKTSESGDEYRAVFTNSVGKADTTAATLTVVDSAIAPEVTKDPSSATVLEGEEARFEAAASGVPVPSVQWELSTNAGGSWSPVSGATSDVLRVASAKTSESGDEYRAVFTNSAGKAETTAATLTVHAPPRVTKGPSSATVLEGEEARFEAAATGSPAPSVQWEVSTNAGVSWGPVSGATSDVLLITSAKTSESGDEYRAVFKNTVGEAKTEPPAILTVDAVPEVTKDPSSATVLEGEEAKFEAAASGVPAPGVQWELSTNAGGSWSPVAGATSDVLRAASAKTSESGDEYRAVFTNSAGKAETTAATLTVHAPPGVTKEPASVEVVEGEEAKFEAAATGAPAPSVQWELSTNAGASWSPVSGATSDVLRAASAKTSESGDEYRAVFTNTVGEADTTAATLTVESKQAHESKERAETEAREAKEREEAKTREEEAAKLATLAFKEGSPDATMASGSLLASRSGAINVKIVCPAVVKSCTGTVTVRTLDAVLARAGSAKAKRAVLTLASGSFTVAGGASKAVTLHLSGKARTLLARLHSVRVRVTVTAHDPAGGAHTGQTITTLRVASAKHVKR